MQCHSQAIECINTPRMYSRPNVQVKSLHWSGYFLIVYEIEKFKCNMIRSFLCKQNVSKKLGRYLTSQIDSSFLKCPIFSAHWWQFEKKNVQVWSSINIGVSGECATCNLSNLKGSLMNTCFWSRLLRKSFIEGAVGFLLWRQILWSFPFGPFYDFTFRGVNFR